MNDAIRKRIERATVEFTQRQGQGVLTYGEVVLTSSDRVSKRPTAETILSNMPPLEPVLLSGGGGADLAPLSIDFATDLAAFEHANDRDPKGYSDRNFSEWVAEVEPSKISSRRRTPGETIDVHLFLGGSGWTTGRGCFEDPDSPRLSITCDEYVGRKYVAGGPVVDDVGELVGIISHFSEIGATTFRNGQSFVSTTCDGIAVRPFQALPVWLCQRCAFAVVR